jgi:hypothetical protein
MSKVEVEAGYHCPFCPEHQDDVFHTSVLVDVPICDGCSEELFHYSHFDTRPNDLLIDQVEQHTGKSWSECKAILLRHQLAQWQSIEDGQRPDWFGTTMGKLGWSEEEARAYVREQVQRYQLLVRDTDENP